MNNTDPMIKVASSKEAAIRFLRGEPGALPKVLWSLVERTALIGAGIYVLGSRENLLKNSIAGSVAIEAYLLWYYGKQMREMEWQP
jgi:hypothetical protein